MQKIIIFCFAFFLFLNLPSTMADGFYGQGPRYLQSTGYGGSSSSYSSSSSSYGEEYEQENSYSGGGSSSYTPSYEEKYEEYHEEVYEQYHEEVYEQYHEEYYNNNNNYGGYGSYTPSYEEEYGNNQSYYGGYGTTSTYEEQNEEVYETPSYGYGGNPSYNNVNNNTYTSQYEEAYVGGSEGGETGESGGGAAPNVPFVPTSLLTGFVVDIHFLAGDPRFQYIAYHYCSDLYPGYTQCDIYNGTQSNSRLVATEIVVSAEIFAQLPMQERKYWHSHAFAVKAGLLVSPNTPPDQDLAVMSSVMNSYGKVTDFWHSYQTFPYGGAKLAYGLADASQVNETIAKQMDQELGLSTTWKERAAARKNLNPTIIEGADAYLTTGEFPQYVTQMFPVATAETGETGGGALVAEEGGFVAEGNGGGENIEISLENNGEGENPTSG